MTRRRRSIPLEEASSPGSVTAVGALVRVAANSTAQLRWPAASVSLFAVTAVATAASTSSTVVDEMVDETASASVNDGTDDLVGDDDCRPLVSEALLSAAASAATTSALPWVRSRSCGAWAPRGSAPEATHRPEAVVPRGVRRHSLPCDAARIATAATKTASASRASARLTPENERPPVTT